MKRHAIPAPDDLYLLVNPTTGEVGDAVLFEVIGKYKTPGFVPVRYVKFAPRRPLSRAVERVRDGVRERRCNKCQGFFPLSRMRPAKGCTGGRSNECRGCHRERHNLARAAKRSKGST